MRLSEALTILQDAPSDGERFRAALVCGFMPLHLQTFLTARLQLALSGRPVDIETGLYGDFLGNLERLAGSLAEVTFVVMEWPDLDPRLGLRSSNGWRQTDLAEIVDHVRAKLARIQELIEGAATPVVLQLPTLLLLPLDRGYPAWRANQFQFRLQEILASFALWVVSRPSVKVANSGRLDRISPPSGRCDVQSELLSGFPYSLAHADAVSEVLALLACSPPPKKGLITDLDDTLWKGIVGEIGAASVSWELDKKSHIHGIYQEILRSLAETGVLIAVASKNEPAVVEEVFRRQDLLLSKDRIFPFEVHWSSKSDSVSRILQMWNISADSVVLVDDSPSELAEVKGVHPAVECILFPKSPQEILSLAERLRDLFAKPAATDEDRLRLPSIRGAQTMQEESRAFAGTPDAFLEQADSAIALNFEKTSSDPRVLDLLNKTNQFNLNGKRFTEASLLALLQDPCAFLLKASYSDKFAALGKIAILIGRVTRNGLHIESWVMSCRAFSRRIEHACLNHLFSKFDVDEIDFDYLVTERNKPLRDFFDSILESPPEAPVRLSRDQFRQNCPRLFHRLEEEF